MLHGMSVPQPNTEIPKSLFMTYTNDLLCGLEKLIKLPWDAPNTLDGPEGKGLDYCHSYAKMSGPKNIDKMAQSLGYSLARKVKITIHRDKSCGHIRSTCRPEVHGRSRSTSCKIQGCNAASPRRIPGNMFSKGVVPTILSPIPSIYVARVKACLVCLSEVARKKGEEKGDYQPEPKVRGGTQEVIEALEVFELVARRQCRISKFFEENVMSRAVKCQH
ncbi:hypothetical protein GG344DRAFT_71178 [Lentinula edodes]|nr:hypothetical protein GG344DRAFT_71178 [Lentinula edodes]